jgi:hypothetical protein
MIVNGTTDLKPASSAGNTRRCFQRFVSTPLQVVDNETNKNPSFSALSIDISGYVV